MLGDHEISVYYGHPAIGALATDGPYTIFTDSGSETVDVDFNRRACEWQVLGRAGYPRYVEETVAANGVILVDVVGFVRVAS